jgi:hypothetical protein
MSSKFIGGKAVISLDSRYYKRFSETLNEEKDKRIAQESLRDIVVFYKALEKTMQDMMAADKKGVPLDGELFAKMVTVKEKYIQMENAFEAKDDDRFRDTLFVLADTTKDLLTHLHRKRKH